MLYSICRKNNIYHIYTNNVSLCQKVSLENEECLCACEEKEVRIKVAKLANSGKQICEICVSKLYYEPSKDEENLPFALCCEKKELGELKSGFEEEDIKI